VPNATGMVEAGKDHGRVATSHFFKADGISIGAEVSIMAHLYQKRGT
jgi:hypothetical protein